MSFEGTRAGVFEQKNETPNERIQNAFSGATITELEKYKGQVNDDLKQFIDEIIKIRQRIIEVENQFSDLTQVDESGDELTLKSSEVQEFIVDGYERIKSLYTEIDTIVDTMIAEDTNQTLIDIFTTLEDK